jgi:hypothetical protein
MHKYILMAIIFILFCIFAIISIAQNKQTEKSIFEKYEYIVVALPSEKTYVTDSKPPARPPFNPYGSERFKQTSFPESVEQEYILDFYGKDGWRLVNIIGVVGGDKLYYFERKFK